MNTFGSLVLDLEKHGLSPVRPRRAAEPPSPNRLFAAPPPDIAFPLPSASASVAASPQSASVAASPRGEGLYVTPAPAPEPVASEGHVLTLQELRAEEAGSAG